MTTIWKTTLQSASVQTIEVPVGSELLCAREQYDTMCVWFRCDPAEPKEKRTIAVCGTGHAAPPPDEARYLGTCSLAGGSLMFHVFEMNRPY